MEVKRKISSQPLDHQSAEVATRLVKMLQISLKKELTGHDAKEFLDDKGNGKYQLDLWKANEIILTEAGIRPENLDITDICTCCNPDLLFSHRASHGKRGIWAVLCVYNFLKSRSKNAEAFLN